MWFLQRLRSRGKMDSFEAKSQLDNQQIPDSRLQSDPFVDNDNLAQAIASDLQNLVLSSKDEEVVDRCIQGHSGVIEEKDQVKEAIDEDHRHLVPKETVIEAFQAESSSGSEEKNREDVRQFGDEDAERHRLEKVLEPDPKECRVLEEAEKKVYEHKDGDLKEKHEIEVEDMDVSSEIGGYEDNGEQRTSEGGNDGEFEHAEDLENESEIVGGDGWEEGSATVPDDGNLKAYHYPLRLDAEDCSYYTRTGSCKFGSNCKYNHPLRRKNQPAKETKKQKEENGERHRKVKCKFHTSSAGCKNGRACKFNHGRGKTVKTPVVEYNFVGLPIRPREKECPYYMRNGSCKYGPSCRFNHPEPTSVEGGDAPTTYGNDVPRPLQPEHQPKISNMPSWSSPRTPDPITAFVPMMYPPAQNMPQPNPDWNGYQAPPAHLYPSSERGLPIPPAFFLNNPPSDTNMYTNHQPPMLISEYPERPSQPDCSYFMKTGDCKYRASCKFHHPQRRNTRNSREMGQTGPSL